MTNENAVQAEADPQTLQHLQDAQKNKGLNAK